MEDRGPSSAGPAPRTEHDKTSDGAGDSTSAGAGHRSWRNLLELDARIFKKKNIRLLTPEARVLIYLKLTGSVSVTTAMKVAGTSYRGFYAVLERLKQAGLVAQVKDVKDQRVRKLSLDPSSPLSPDDVSGPNL